MTLRTLVAGLVSGPLFNLRNGSLGKMFTHKNLMTVCCAAVLAFGLAACGSSSDDDKVMDATAERTRRRRRHRMVRHSRHAGPRMTKSSRTKLLPWRRPRKRRPSALRLTTDRPTAGLPARWHVAAFVDCRPSTGSNAGANERQTSSTIARDRDGTTVDHHMWTSHETRPADDPEVTRSCRAMILDSVAAPCTFVHDGTRMKTAKS